MRAFLQCWRPSAAVGSYPPLHPEAALHSGPLNQWFEVPGQLSLDVEWTSGRVHVLKHHDITREYHYSSLPAPTTTDQKGSVTSTAKPGSIRHVDIPWNCMRNRMHA